MTLALSARDRPLARPCVPLLALFMLGGCPDDTASTVGATSATEASSTGDTSTTSSSSTSTTTSTGTTAAIDTMMTESTTVFDDTTSTSSSSSGSTTTGTTSSTGSTGSTGSTTAASGVCGDAVSDPGEECDLGEAKNGNGDYGGCNDDCTLQPSCNDEKHQPLYEECDPSDPLFAEAAVCTDACTWKGVIVFLTSGAVTADLDGLDGADTVCRNFAKDAGLQKWDQYRAWLSVGTSTAASRIPLVARPYYRLDGQKIAENATGLLSSKLLLPANISETKEDLGLSIVWTNTRPDGSTTSETDDCQSFSTPDEGEKTYIGLSNKTDAQWTHAGALSFCDDKARLYCFSPAF